MLLEPNVSYATLHPQYPCEHHRHYDPSRNLGTLTYPSVLLSGSTSPKAAPTAFTGVYETGSLNLVTFNLVAPIGCV